METLASDKRLTIIILEGRRYFQLTETKGRNVSVKCTLCPGEKLVSTSVNSAANLTEHLKGKHANVKLVAQDDVMSNDPCPSKELKRLFHQVTKTDLDRVVALFIVEEVSGYSLFHGR